MDREKTSRSIAAMAALNGLKIWHMLDPDDNSPYKAVAAVLNDSAELDPHIARVNDIILRISKARFELNSPRAGVLVACEHAMRAVMTALVGGENCGNEAVSHVKLATKALSDD